MQQLLSQLIRCYKRWVSIAIQPRCRFYPTCSSYALQAIEQFGVAKGLWLGLKRLCRCHPFCQGGFDPVPATDIH